MGLPRSTFYDAPSLKADDAEIIANMIMICDEFETYGYRRVGAELRHRGILVNSKKIRRLMREHDLQPKRRKRFVATTDSDHDGPIFPDRPKTFSAVGFSGYSVSLRQLLAHISQRLPTIAIYEDISSTEDCSRSTSIVFSASCSVTSRSQRSAMRRLIIRHRYGSFRSGFGRPK